MEFCSQNLVKKGGLKINVQTKKFTQNKMQINLSLISVSLIKQKAKVGSCKIKFNKRHQLTFKLLLCKNNQQYIALNLNLTHRISICAVGDVCFHINSALSGFNSVKLGEQKSDDIPTQ